MRKNRDKIPGKQVLLLCNSSVEYWTCYSILECWFTADDIQFG